MNNLGIGSWITRRRRDAAHRRALVFEGRSWTYGELAERIDRLANVLRGVGTRLGDRVGYLGPNHPAFIELLFAAGSLGAIPLPINFRLAEDEVVYIVEDSGCRVLLFASEAAETVEVLRGRTFVDSYIPVDSTEGDATVYEQLLARSSAEWVDVPVDQDDIGLLVYTSGTTGRPKGVMLSHGNLTWNAVNFLVTGGFRPDDVSLAIAPFFRVGGLGVTLLETFLVGGTVVLMPTFESGRALELIERYGVTVLFGGPDLLQGLQDHPSFPRIDMSSVRICYTGGAPVPEHLIRSYLERGVPILQGYGLSEAAPLALLLHAEDMTRKIGSAGKPPFFTDVRIVRPDLTDVAPGEVGEVLVSGPNVMKGYWNRPDATAETIVAGHWLRTGDAARSDDQGYIYMVGRMADAYMADGRLVFPGDIERILVDHPAVRDVAVVGVADDTLGETGVAFVVAVSDAETSEDDLLEWTAAHLDRPETLREVRFTDAIPRNPAGKVLRHALRRLAESDAPT